MGIPDWLSNLIFGAGGGVAVAFGLFKFMGESWIKHKLSTDLEKAKTEIAFAATRRMKLHDKEYEVFPVMWQKLVEARDTLTASIYSFNRIPNFKQMTADEIQQWPDKANLDAEEKEFFLGELDKDRAICRILDSRKLNAAGKAFDEFRNHLHTNRIFLSPDLKEKFDEIEQKLRSGWAAKKVDFDHNGDTGSTDLVGKAFEVCEKEIKPLMIEIEELVQQRLFPEVKKGNNNG